MNSTLKVGLLFGLLYIGFANAANAAGPDPNSNYIQSISYAGSGCPQGTVGQSISNDRQTFTLIFDSFVASAGPGVPLTEATKNCVITLNLHLAPGWTTWVQTVMRRGYVQLPAGSATGVTNAKMTPPSRVAPAMGNNGVDVSSNFKVSGPAAKDYVDFLSPVVTAHAPADVCNTVKPLTLSVQIQVPVPSGGQAQVTNDSIDGKLSQVVGSTYCH